MSTTTEQICIEALSLPRQARAEIAHRLLLSLEDEDFDNNVDETWLKEIQRRRQDFLNGTAKGVPAEEALRQAYAAIQ